MTEDTRLIPLTQGKFAVVDARDYDYLMQWSWFACRVRHKIGDMWYAARRKRYGPRKEGRAKTIYMHQEVAKLRGSTSQQDHHDHDGLNNCMSNLRDCNQSQNNGNFRKQVGTSSRFKGVCWAKSKNKWQANIKINYKGIFLGRFDSEVDAAHAYDLAAIKYFGEFACLNFPMVSEEYNSQNLRSRCIDP